MVVATVLALVLGAEPSSYDARLQRARERIAAFEEEAALKDLEVAAAASAADPKRLAQVYLYRGIALGGLAEGDKAIESFRAALALDATVEPPEVSERIAGWYDEARARSGFPPRPKPAAAPPRLATWPDEATTVPEPPKRSWKLYAGLGAVAGAAALAVTGAAFGNQARSLEARRDGVGDLEHSRALHRDAVRRAQTANMFFGAGGALAAGGAVLLVLEF